MSDTREFQERIGRIDGLVQKIESTADPALRRTAKELIGSLMEIHGAGLERILQIVSNAGETGAALVESLARDELVSSLLVLYGLHPEDFESRVRRGLDKVRPLLRSHGARLDLISVIAGSVEIRIAGAGSNDFETTVREALLETAPDATTVVIEGGKPSGHASGFVPLTSLRPASGPSVAVADCTRS